MGSAHRIPKLRKHKTGQGVVRLNGRDFYCGRYGQSETEEKYHRIVSEWIASGRRINPEPADITIIELVDRYWSHAKGYYRKADGTPTHEISAIRSALRPLTDLYGSMKAVEFGPKALDAVRREMITRGWVRKSINSQVGRVRRMLRWAAAEELISGDRLHSLAALAPLKKGRSDAKENPPVGTVSEDHIEAVKKQVAPQIRDIIDLMLLTAARPGEILGLRPMDIDRETYAPSWTASPVEHKTAYMEKHRMIPLGPKARQILAPYLLRDQDCCLFTPQETIQQRPAPKGRRRRTNQPESKRKTSRRLSERYVTSTFNRAITRACEVAGIPKWTANRLRHTGATRLRQTIDLEAAQVVLGHSSKTTTEIYTVANEVRAVEIMERIG